MNTSHVCLCVCLAPCRVPYCFMIYAELSLSFSISSRGPRSMWASAEIHSRADKWLNTCPLSLSTMSVEHEREERTSVGRFCRRSSSVIGQQRCLPLSLSPWRPNLLFDRLRRRMHARTCSLPLRLIGKEEKDREGRHGPTDRPVGWAGSQRLALKRERIKLYYLDWKS